RTGTGPSTATAAWRTSRTATAAGSSTPTSPARAPAPSRSPPATWPTPGSGCGTRTSTPSATCWTTWVARCTCMPAEPRITLLGPQRDPHLKDVVRTLELEGCRFATITAGWREREGEDEILDAELGGNTVNLRLWRLLQQLWEADPELEAADRQRRH